jgi:desulfoferrodoxin-like iron-binding protein
MNETGKRYVCSTCGSELLVTRGGDGTLSCCNQPMQIRAAGGTSAAPASAARPRKEE